MSENGSTNNKLRADAPTFTPSFATPSQNTEQTKKNVDLISDRTKQSSNRNNRRRNQDGRKKSSQKNKKSLIDDGPIDHRSETSEGGKVQKEDVRRSNNNSKRNSGKTKKNSSSRGARNKNKEKSRGRSVDLSDDATEGLVDKESIALPLHTESAFPSLLGPLPGPSGQNRAGKSMSSIWQNPQSKKDLLYTPPTLDANKGSSDETKDDFAALGLQKLSSEAQRKPRSSQYSAWNEGFSDSEGHSSAASPDSADVDLDAPSSSALPSQLIQEMGIRNRRPEWNMNKLRDKWWEAIEHRKRKRNFMIELQDKLRDRIIDPSTDSGNTPPDEATNSAAANKESIDAFDESQIIRKTGPSPLESLLIREDDPDKFASRDDIICRIIQEGDSAALDELLKMWKKSTDPIKYPPRTFLRGAQQIMQQVVKLELPELLNVVLTHLNTFEPSETDEGDDCSTEVAKAFMLAAELGHEGCLSTFLTRWDISSALFTIKDDGGSSVFHHCCRGQGSALVLRILLQHISGGTKSKQQQLSKALLAKDKSSQTALHLACKHGRVDFVEIFLSVCSIALLSKLLTMEDDSSQTPLLAAVRANASDVVTCLIMWRGNRNLIFRKPSRAPGKLMGNAFTLPPCPMVWAAKHGSLDMIQLLVQFSDPSGRNYRITESIVALLLSNATDDTKAEGCQLLVQDGGNPFSEIVAYDGISSDTAVSIAAKSCNTQVLCSLVSTGLQQLRDRQQERRTDPKLRQQPEPFFRGIEEKENFEMERTLANALLESLYSGWEQCEKEEEELPRSLASAVSLYMLGAELKRKDEARLHVSMKARQLKPAGLVTEELNPHCYVTSYVVQKHNASSKFSKLSDLDRSTLSLHSSLLLEMEWFQEQRGKSSCSCPWLSGSHAASSLRDKPRWKDDEVVLIADDGTAFTVHDSIVSAKSAKLASALRFANMQETNGDLSSPSDPRRVLHLDVPSQYCAWMLQHIYHGSIACGWARGSKQQCHEILELMLLAEEFLCFSLLQECEMRLLSANPTECSCWSCVRSIRCHSETDEAAECLYVSYGPSRLLAGATVLDVLAVLQHLGDIDFKYQISQVNRSVSWLKSISPTHLWNQEDTTVWYTHAAMRPLKYASITTILSSYPEVVKSVSFQENSSWNDDSTNDDESTKAHTTTSTEILASRALLLQMCLEELAVSELPKAYEQTKRRFITGR